MNDTKSENLIISDKLIVLSNAYDKSTKGQWRVDRGDTSYYPMAIRAGLNELIFDFHSWDSKKEDNSNFMVMAHNIIPDLLEAVKVLKMAAHALESPQDFTKMDLQTLRDGYISDFIKKKFSV